VRARLDYLAANYGQAGQQRVLDALPAELRAVLDDGILISDWYPLELSEAILDAAERLLGDNDGALCQAIGLASARKGLTSTYAVFASRPDADEIALKMQRTTSLVWRSYYDVAEFHTRATGRDKLQSELTGLNLQTPWLCHVLIGYITGHVEVLGGRNVSVTHVSCTHRGQARCLWEATWQ
jgi:predicted hydrocarbon binding protein